MVIIEESCIEYSSFNELSTYQISRLQVKIFELCDFTKLVPFYTIFRVLTVEWPKSNRNLNTTRCFNIYILLLYQLLTIKMNISKNSCLISESQNQS